MNTEILPLFSENQLCEKLYRLPEEVFEQIHFTAINPSIGPSIRMAFASRWKGIIAEPSPSLLSYLKTHIGPERGIIIEKAAVGKEKAAPDILQRQPYKDIIGQYSNSLVTEPYFHTIQALYQTHKIHRTHYLQIETTNSLAIIDHIDLTKHRPEIINFRNDNNPESLTLSVILKKLTWHGYTIYKQNNNIIAIQ